MQVSVASGDRLYLSLYHSRLASLPVPLGAKGSERGSPKLKCNDKSTCHHPHAPNFLYLILGCRKPRLQRGIEYLDQHGDGGRRVAGPVSIIARYSLEACIGARISLVRLDNQRRSASRLEHAAGPACALSVCDHTPPFRSQRPSQRALHMWQLLCVCTRGGQIGGLEPARLKRSITSESCRSIIVATICSSVHKAGGSN